MNKLDIEYDKYTLAEMIKLYTSMLKSIQHNKY